MIHAIQGQLLERTPASPQGAYCLLLWQGLTWHIHTTSSTNAKLPVPGESCQLYTTLILRDNTTPQLVGFITRDERDLFQILLHASGVGPRVALNLLDCLSVVELVQAVAGGHHKPLTIAKGVGPKLAQKIVLDLKDTLMHWRDGLPALDDTPQWSSLPGHQAFVEAESVLLSLGYSNAEVYRSLGQAPPEETSSESVLRHALHWLAKAV